MRKILNSLFFVTLKIISALLAWLLFRLKVEGRGNLPVRAPFVIASNHASFLDPVVIQVAVPFKISWITKKDIYKKWYLRPLHRLFNSIPVNGAINEALAALTKGAVLGIFPEGARSPDGKFKKADAGLAVLALKGGRPIVPVGIIGAYEAFGPDRKFFRPHPIKIRIGRPFSFKKIDADIIEKRLLSEKQNYIADRIKELLV